MVQFLVLSGYFQQARSHKKKSRKYHSRRLQLPSKKQRKMCTQSKNRIVGLKMCHLPLQLGQQRESPRQMNHFAKAKKATDTKNPLNSKNNDVDGNEQSPENEDAGIIEEFDYHDSKNAENYEKYFEKICKLLKRNSLIIIYNASYHSRNSNDYPKSKWKKAQFEQWLKENKVNFPSDALRSKLWVLCKTHRNEKNAKVVEKIAKKYGMEVLHLPAYHCELNLIELIWADEKNFVAREKKEMTIEHVETLFRKR